MMRLYDWTLTLKGAEATAWRRFFKGYDPYNPYKSSISGRCLAEFN